jgi:hypothetical protein
MFVPITQMGQVGTHWPVHRTASYPIVTPIADRGFGWRIPDSCCKKAISLFENCWRFAAVTLREYPLTQGSNSGQPWRSIVRSPAR